jgi:hypothetical protein
MKRLARTHQTAMDGDEHREHEEAFMHRRSDVLAAPALVRRAGNPGRPLCWFSGKPQA